MIRSVVLSGLLAIAATLACSAPATEAHAEDKAKDAAKFTVTASAKAVKAGAKGSIEVVITPAKGYKWNKDFPSSLVVEGAPANVAFPTKEFDRAAFKESKKDTRIAVPFDAKATGEESVKAKASFSVCNDETCLIFRDEAVDVKVAVR